MCLAGYTRPDVSMAVHQATKFSNDPKLCHDVAAKRIGECLLGKSEEGLICETDPAKGMEACVDADFAGGFDKNKTEDTASVYSRTGNVTKHAGCQILW